VSNILREGVLDNFQDLLFPCDGYFGIEKRPQEVTEVLIKKIGISDCMLDVNYRLNGVLVERIFRSIYDQLRYDVEVFSSAGFKLIGGRLSQEKYQNVQQLIKGWVVLVFFLKSWHEVKRHDDIKVHMVTSFEDIVVG
jgi:hypothetical protein